MKDSPAEIDLHQPHADHKTLSKLCAILEHELKDAVYASVDDISQVARLLG
jgi:hypothetical protein